jgi:uncharacterized phage protein gp47/JayE
MTLNRLVSLRDYESYAKSFVGIGKALATQILMDQGKMVHITVCSKDGSQLDTSSDTFKNLERAIKNRSRTIDRFKISGFKLLTFKIEATLAIDRRHIAKEVERQCTEALRDEFSFFNRNFAQDVTASEIMACLQKVDGVAFARLDVLEFDPSGVNKRAKNSELQKSSINKNVQFKSLQERINPVMQSFGSAGLSREPHGKTNQILRASAAVKVKDEIKPAEMLVINLDASGIKLKILEPTE